MDTNIGNELIADALGFQHTNIGWLDHNEVLANIEEKDTFKPNELKFHLDWDWLFVIIDKCLLSKKVKDLDKIKIKEALVLSDSKERKHNVWVACIHAIQHKAKKN